MTNPKTKDKSRIRGMVFITTLMVSVVVIMLLTAALTLLPASQGMTGSVRDDALAQSAAQAGLEYALTRLQENPQWKGDDNKVVVDKGKDLWVREDRGNVIGLVGSPSGETTMFRIRFNFQNGTNKPNEGLDDPTPSMRMDTPYVSYNSLERGAREDLYRGDGEGARVHKNSKIAGDVPGYSAVVYSEGLAGPGLREVTPNNLVTEAKKLRVSSRVVECFYGRDISRFGDSVIYAGDTVTMNLSEELIVHSGDDSNPRVRTLGNLNVTADKVEMNDGEVYVSDTNGHFHVNGVDSTDPVATLEDSSNKFLELGWSDLTQPAVSDATLPAGTYVWRAVPNGSRIDYYAQEYDPVVGPPAATVSPDASYQSSSSDLASVNGAVRIDATTATMNIRKNVTVRANGTAVGLAVVPEPGFLATRQMRPTIDIAPVAQDDANPIVSSAGDLRFEGRVKGKGSLTTGGSISIQGSSLLETSPSNQVALFAKHDIEVNAVPSELASDGGVLAVLYGSSGSNSNGNLVQNGIQNFFGNEPPTLGVPKPADVGFMGVIYAQGDFRVNLDNGISRGDFYLRGVLVSYGGDYESGSSLNTGPGVNGKGIVDITAEGVDLNYDSSFVTKLKSQGDYLPLEVVSWRTL